MAYRDSVFLGAQTVFFRALLWLLLGACHCLGFRLFGGTFIRRFADFLLASLAPSEAVGITLLLQKLVSFASFKVPLLLLEIREESI